MKELRQYLGRLPLEASEQTKIECGINFNTTQAKEKGFPCHPGNYISKVLKLIEQGEFEGSAIRVLTIDPSLNYIGICLAVGGNYLTGNIQPGIPRKSAGAKTFESYLKASNRLDFIGYSIEEIIKIFEPDYILIEGYALGAAKKAQTNNIVNIGEAVGVIKRILAQYCKATEAVMTIEAPTRLKMLATNNGLAPKELMRETAFKLYGADFSSLDKDDDEIDAFLFAKIVQAFLNKVFTKDTLSFGDCI